MSEVAPEEQPAPASVGFAVWSADLDEVIRLLDAGSDVDVWSGAGDRTGTTPLMEAVDEAEASFDEPRQAIVAALLAHGADVHRADVAGRTALHFAAGAGRDVVEALVEAGADVNARSRSGQTALGEALDRGCASAARALIEHGADPTEVDGPT